LSDVQKWLAVDILSLGMAADDARRASADGNIVTYQRVHIVAPGDVGNGAAIPEAASEVRLFELPESREAALAQIRLLKSLAGSRRVSAYSMTELAERAASGWGPLPELLAALVGAGLSDVAELAADQVADVGASLRALVTAGGSPARITIAQPVADRKGEIVEHVRRGIADAARPVSFSPLARHAPLDKPTTGYEDLRMVALARLAIAATAATPVKIEIDWSLYGPKLAQVALTFGADHFDAVPASSDPALGRRRGTVEDVERNIRAAGFEPRETR
jgi:hypothetical protein